MAHLEPVKINIYRESEIKVISAAEYISDVWRKGQVARRLCVFAITLHTGAYGREKTKNNKSLECT